MLTVDECKSCAADYKSLAKEPGVSKERAAVLKNISMAWEGWQASLSGWRKSWNGKQRQSRPRTALELSLNFGDGLAGQAAVVMG